MLDFQRVVFHIPWVFKFPPELWRPFTSFWITGPDLGILIDTFFSMLEYTYVLASRKNADGTTVWQYSNKLERDSKRFSQPGDFFTYIFFIELFILVCIFRVLSYDVV